MVYLKILSDDEVLSLMGTAIPADPVQKAAKAEREHTIVWDRVDRYVLTPSQRRKLLRKFGGVSGAGTQPNAVAWLRKERPDLDDAARQQASAARAELDDLIGE